MKPIIGIVSNFNTEDQIRINDNIVRAIELSDGEPIAIITKAENDVGVNVLNTCDGFIFQGGLYSSDYHYNILDYAFKHKKPVLGICLGFQFMARYFFGCGSVEIIENLDIKNLLNHSDGIGFPTKKSHYIVINESSYMYKIFGERYPVNTRHSKTVVHVEKPFIVSALAEDGIIEGMEYIDDDNYIVGVQFHPENLDDMKPIFDRFIKRAAKNIK